MQHLSDQMAGFAMPYFSKAAKLEPAASEPPRWDDTLYFQRVRTQLWAEEQIDVCKSEKITTDSREISQVFVASDSYKALKKGNQPDLLFCNCRKTTRFSHRLDVMGTTVVFPLFLFQTRAHWKNDASCPVVIVGASFVPNAETSTLLAFACPDDDVAFFYRWCAHYQWALSNPSFAEYESFVAQNCIVDVPGSTFTQCVCGPDTLLYHAFLMAGPPAEDVVNFDAVVKTFYNVRHAIESFVSGSLLRTTVPYRCTDNTSLAFYIRCAHDTRPTRPGWAVSVCTLEATPADAKICSTLRQITLSDSFEKAFVYEFIYTGSSDMQCTKTDAQIYGMAPVLDEDAHLEWVPTALDDDGRLSLEPKYHERRNRFDVIADMHQVFHPTKGSHAYRGTDGIISHGIAPMWFAPLEVIDNICNAFGVRVGTLMLYTSKLKEKEEDVRKVLASRKFDVVAVWYHTVGNDLPHVAMFFWQEPGYWTSVGVWEEDFTLDRPIGTHPYAPLDLTVDPKTVPDFEWASCCQSVAFQALLLWLTDGFINAVQVHSHLSVWHVEYWKAIGTKLLAQVDIHAKDLIPNIRQFLYSSDRPEALPKWIEFKKEGEPRVWRLDTRASRCPPNMDDCAITSSFSDLGLH